MILLVNDMQEVEQVAHDYRHDIQLLYNNLLKLPRVQCRLDGQIKIPENTFAIYLPDSNAFIFKFYMENSSVEWVMRQCRLLKDRDERNSKTKPVFLRYLDDSVVSEEVVAYLMKML